MVKDKTARTVINALRQNAQRHLYEGRDGRWHISYEGPDVRLSDHEVKVLERRGVIVLDFPGFYRLAPLVHSTGNVPSQSKE